MGSRHSVSIGSAGIGEREFIALAAAMMALNALSIDTMLPALPQIGAALHVARDNARQLVVTAYMLGLGGAQIIYGPLSDRFGRKPVLLLSVCGYVLFSALTVFAATFPLLIIGRFAQGVCVASTRVITVAVVRDVYSGRAMARILSLAMSIVIAAPVLAPSLGQLILFLAPWRAIFGLLMAFGVGLMLWIALRLPETLHPEYRRPLAVRPLASVFRTALTTRQAIGYTLAQMVLNANLYGFVNSAEQIYRETFHVPRLFPMLFASIAIGMAIAGILNARIVPSLGTRRISHGALIVAVIILMTHWAVALAGRDTLWTFQALRLATLFCLGLALTNFSAMAMEPMAALAGTGAAVQGCLSTLGGAVIGYLIGQQYDGTTLPIVAGFALSGLSALIIVLITERGQLFHPRMGP